MALPRVVVVDYGIGNVFSVCQAVRHAGGEPSLTGNHEAILRADRLILPGVGAFGNAAFELRERGLVAPLEAFRASDRPFLGICVGMQLMLEQSAEFGRHDGLGFVLGRVDRIPDSTTAGGRLRVPHIGWSELLLPEAAASDRWRGTLFDAIQPGRSAFYFIHSFGALPAREQDVLAEVEYGGNRLVAAIEIDNLTGVQFHPERSGPAGQAVLKRFLAS
jgi:glutamine amidotransferase